MERQGNCGLPGQVERRCENHVAEQTRIVCVEIEMGHIEPACRMRQIGQRRGDEDIVLVYALHQTAGEQAHCLYILGMLCAAYRASELDNAPSDRLDVRFG